MKVCIFWNGGAYQKPWDHLLLALEVSSNDVYLLLHNGENGITSSHMLGSCNRLERIENLPPGPLVVASPRETNHLNGTVPLYDFVHPEDAIYVFGADSHSLHPDMFKERAITHKVYIPSAKMDLFSHLAGAMVLYDRRCKQS